MNPQETRGSFVVKDCSVLTVATGVSASSLIDLREKIALAGLECLYYHFWTTRLRPYFVHSGYHNDFAVWVHQVLNEAALAEKLSVLDPLRFNSLEDLRSSILEILDEGLDANVSSPWLKKEQFFHFISSKIIVMNTLKTMDRPEDLVHTIDHLSTSSIFYHFIDARRHARTSQDDFSLWLGSFGEAFQPLIQRFAAVDVYFLSLSEIKKRLSNIVHDFF
jgi:hypothetical protein